MSCNDGKLVVALPDLSSCTCHVAPAATGVNEREKPPSDADADRPAQSVRQS
jgi:hypothetical protein